MGVWITQTEYGPGKAGRLPDGRKVTVRPGSSESRPTLEIRKKNERGHEVRYDEPEDITTKG